MESPSSLGFKHLAPSDGNNSSPRRMHNSSGSCLLEHSITRKEFQNKGKEMWQLMNNRKEVEEKLKKLENRIKHISVEQQKTEKIIEDTKKKHEKYSKIRDGVSQDKLFKNDLREQQEKERNELKKKYMKESQDLKLKIKENKMKTTQKNAEMKKAIIEKQQNDLLKKEEERKNNYIKLREKCIRVSDSIKKIHHKRNSSYQALKTLKEEQYLKKMQQEMKAQEDALKKIQELEQLESGMMENFENTKKLQDTVNSILSSPMHKDLNILCFNL